MKPHSPSATSFASLPLAMQRLDALVDWERGSRSRMRVDASAIGDVLSRLGSPHKRFRSVHVTGTKGKGSVCSLVDAGLRCSGFRVGRYTSPHLEAVNERIHLDGHPIPDDALAAALSSALDARDNALADGSAGADATWFDIMTAAAFVAFARARVEWAVVEVGIGGRLDSTNVLSSDVAVITNVGLEHTDVLGETIEAIAAEKAGIIEANGTLVTPISPSSAAGRVVVATARRCEATVRQVEVPEHATLSEINLATAREVFEALGALGVRGRADAPPLGAATLSAAVIAKATMPGRMERFRVPCSHGARVSVVMDGAHVDFALTGVLSELRLDPALRPPPIVLMALGSDKNATAMLGALVGIAGRVVCVQLPHGRPSWRADQLMDFATAIGLPAETAQTPEAGLQKCLDIGFAGWILITGSLHLVGALRRTLTTLATAEDWCGNQEQRQYQTSSF